jgi:GNAT superfamily N-acetyltransferase
MVDIPDALELSRVAGWNQTYADWVRMLELSPDGCFCVERDGQVVATATLVAYGTECAWIGMVLTHTNWRGQGFARTLIQHLLATARALHIETVKLDATSQGRSLYESLGFVPEQDVERWERSGVPVHIHAEHTYSFAMDEIAHGYSRGSLLQSLGAKQSQTGTVDACALSRPGLVHAYVGPCVARDADSAQRALAAILDVTPASGWYWDLMPKNRNAAALADSLGFRPVRRLVRMRLGRQLCEREQDIYAIAGFEFG